jgi:hypothetical protein
MLRSLRSVGCDLPVKVIPYDENRFQLPEGCEWFEDQELMALLQDAGAHKMMRKYLCLLEHSYQFVDSDVVFTRNPSEVLRPFGGFISSCGNWRDPAVR